MTVINQVKNEKESDRDDSEPSLDELKNRPGPKSTKRGHTAEAVESLESVDQRIESMGSEKISELLQACGIDQ